MKNRKTNTALFIALCTLVYFTSYITRKVYASTMLEIIRDLSFTNESAGLVNTALFITYGAGQIVSGILGDHIAPHKLIFCGIVTSSACNLLMPLFPSVLAMTILWAINGFCQALFWPPLVRMMAEHLSADDYSRACVTVSIGASFATVCIYLTSSLLIAISGWQLNFYASGMFGLFVSIIWIALTSRMEQNDGAVQKENKSAETTITQKNISAKNISANNISFGRLVILSGLIPICACIILQGMLRDGLDSWMPTLISDTFHLSSVVSTLSGVVMPLFAMPSIKFTQILQRVVRNELRTVALLFVISAVLSGALYVLYDCNIILTILMIASLTGCMHGINLILVSWVPAYFAKYGKISTFSGIMNAFTYIGSALSMYGFGAASDKLGWHATIISWILICFVGIALSVCTVRRWIRFSEK